MYATESLTLMVLILVESLGGQHATPNLVPYLLVYSPYVIIPAVVGWRCAGWPHVAHTACCLDSSSSSSSSSQAAVKRTARSPVRCS